MIPVWLSSDPAVLAAKLAEYAYTATVEAEYGEVVVEGTVLTLAHHGARSGNPAPCLQANVLVSLEAFGVSHVDLDTIGGLAALQGYKPEAESFWRLAAFVDVHGAHKLGEAGASEQDIARLYAWWAWSDAMRLRLPKDEKLFEVSEWVREAIWALQDILNDAEPSLMAAGLAFRQAEAKLNDESFIGMRRGLVGLRAAETFTNHLYVTPMAGIVCKAIVAFRTDVKTVTVSLSDPIEGVSCRDVVQRVFPEKDAEGRFLAGGHDSIAGSPRGRECTFSDAEAAAAVLADMILR